MTPSLEVLQNWRRERLQRLLDEKLGGVKADLGRALGYSSGAFVRQMLAQEKPISERTVAAIHAIRGCSGWMDPNPELSASSAANSAASLMDSLGHVLDAIDAAPETPRRLARHIIGQLVAGEGQRDEWLKVLAAHLGEPVPPPTWRDAASAWALSPPGAQASGLHVLAQIDQTYLALKGTWREQQQQKQMTRCATEIKRK